MSNLKDINWFIIDLDYIFKINYIKLKYDYLKESSKYNVSKYEYLMDVNFMSNLLKNIKENIQLIVSYNYLYNYKYNNNYQFIILINELNNTNLDTLWRNKINNNWSVKYNIDFNTYKKDNVWNNLLFELNIYFKEQDYIIFNSNTR